MERIVILAYFSGLGGLAGWVVEYVIVIIVFFILPFLYIPVSRFSRISYTDRLFNLKTWFSQVIN